MEYISSIKITVEVDTNKAMDREVFDNIKDAADWYQQVIEGICGAPVAHPLIGAVKEHLADLSDQDRLDFISACMEDHCRWCGTEHLPCYCMSED